ncbi:MAG: ribosome biogenesis GTP-binding protein YihA/YsxC [Candidatus Binatia bacterium]
MKITAVEFLKSTTSPVQYPKEALPEVAFVGRSNVGKSSVINALLQRKGLAKTSSTPGKTQQINFFKVNDRWTFVDLPGYGYARVPEAIRAGWRPMVEAYLSHRQQLKATVHILDIRVGPTALDFVMREWLGHYRIFAITVLSKADKLNRAQRQKALKRLGKTPFWQEGQPCTLFSAKTGEGRVELWRLVRKELEAPRIETRLRCS